MVYPALLLLMRTPRLPVVDWTDAPPCRFKWTRPFRRKTKSGFSVCAIWLQTQCTTVSWILLKRDRHTHTYCIFYVWYKYFTLRTAQSVRRLPTGWTVRESNPGEGEIFRICPDRPWGPPSLLYNGYRVFPGDNLRPGRDADPSPPSSTEVKNRVQLYLYSA